MKLSIIFLLALGLRAEDASPNPELEAAKARVGALEQTVAALQKKVQACFDIYAADMTLVNLAKQQTLATPSEPSHKVDEQSKRATPAETRPDALPPANSAPASTAPPSGGKP